MGELDNETFSFNNEFKKKVLEKRSDFSKLCNIEYLPKTDHTFIFETSRKYVLNSTLNWLNSNYG